MMKRQLAASNASSNQNADVARLVEECNRFAFRLYAQLAADAENNLFFSPSSMSLALAMTFAGANGETAREMAEVLGFSLPAERLHEAFRQLQAQTKTGGIDLRVANRLWGDSGYPFRDDFLQTTESCYQAGLERVDFRHATEASRQQINAWVEEQTSGKIAELIPSGVLDFRTRLVLTNAIYFLGSWENQFNAGATAEGPFYTAGREYRIVPMMRIKESFQYGEFNDLQVLELPYSSKMISMDADEPAGGDRAQNEVLSAGSDFSMCILLPRQSDGIDELDRQLAASGPSKWKALRDVEVEVTLPKFRLETSARMDDILMALGMKLAFSEIAADFSKMTDDPIGLFVSAVLHKAHVDVNEKGTEAAAASAVEMKLRGLPQDHSKMFHANHPFVFLIRDRGTGLVHFIGRVASLGRPV